MGSEDSTIRGRVKSADCLSLGGTDVEATDSRGTYSRSSI